ncbi:MAG: hypothetical protein KIH71_000850 [Roseobacter sp.]|nr:hypothetical protein [Roseobacter sp.]
MLIALALTYRLVKKQTQTYVYVGLLAALLWTVWTLTDPFGVQTSTLLRQNSLLVSALLYLSALIDWSRSLLKSRLTVFDWLTTCVFCLCLVSLAAFFWLN